MISKLPIFNFHHIGENGYPTRLFQRFLHDLYTHGYQSIDLIDAIDLLRNSAVPENTFVITFDDGYASTLTDAAPVLQKLGFTATLFPLTPGSRETTGKRRYFEGKELLSLPEIRELHTAGFSIGSHTVDHPDLTRISKDQVITQLEVSTDILRQCTGHDIHSFAYPYGRLDARIKTIIKRQFKCACGTTLALNRKSTDQYSLNRIDMEMFNRPFLTRLLTHITLPLYLKLRGDLLNVQTKYLSL